MNVETISIKILLFGACREAAGIEELDYHLAPSSTAESAWTELKNRFPDLARFDRSILMAVNEEHTGRDTILNSGDTLAIFPPVSGG